MIAFTVDTVNDISDIQHQRTERGRITALGRRTDSGERCTLLVIHEFDGSCKLPGLGAPGVRLSEADAVALCESILERVR